jgi:prepilin signal peptidase PulO-like enzyme (type II secretory pathway)
MNKSEKKIKNEKSRKEGILDGIFNKFVFWIGIFLFFYFFFKTYQRYGYFPYAVGSGLGILLAVFLFLFLSYLVRKHNERLTDEQRKKSDRNAWIILGIIVLLFIIFYIIMSIIG